MQAEGEQRVQSLAHGCLLALHADATPPGIAALAQELFPAAAALRINVVTGDPQVLASVGSLLAPGPLALALLPLHASAAGAAVVRQAPIFLTEEGRQGLACYDFEGGAVFCLPIIAAGQQAGPAMGGAAGGAVQHAPAAQRCLGALLLSFAAPAQLDAAHARNLLLLSRAVAPGLLAAAGPLLQQCALILGVPPQPAAEEEEEEEEQEQEGSIYLTESEEGEGELPPVWEEEEAEAAALAEEEEALRQQQAQQAQPQWAAGSCREQPPEPPEDPGSAAAALAVQPQPQGQAESKAEVAAAAGERITRRSGSGSSGMAAPAAATAALVAAPPVPPSPTAVASRITSFESSRSVETPRSPVLLQEARQLVQPVQPLPLVPAVPPSQPPTSPGAVPAGRSRLSIEGPRSAEPQPPQEPESPSVAKARAKAAAAAAAAAAGEAAAAAGPSTSAAPDTSGGPGSGFSAPPLLKVSPSESEASQEPAASATLAREAGSSLLRLLCFEDPALEARFARWLHAQLWRTDLLSMCLAVTLQLTLLCTGGSGGAPLPWAALQWATVLAPLALMLGWSTAYMRHRDLVMALWYLSCGCWRLCTTSGGGGAAPSGAQGGWLPWLGPVSVVALGMGAQLCSLAARTQSRLCVQAPLQGLLFASNASALLRSCHSSMSDVLQAFVLTVLLPLSVLYKLEMEARTAFLVRLPLLPPELPSQPQLVTMAG